MVSPLTATLRSIAGIAFATITLISTPHAQANDQDDFFERHDATLSGEGNFYSKSFTFDSITDLTIYFAATGNTSCFLVDDENLEIFEEEGIEGEFSVFGTINGNVGTSSFSIPNGTFHLIVASFQEESFRYSIELEKHPFGLDGKVFQGAVGRIAEFLEPGEVTGVGFTTDDRTTYTIEGCNTGVGFYIIPDDQIDNVNGARPFTYLTEFSSPDNDPDAPSTQRIHPSAGSYFVIARNNTTERQSVAVNLYAYQGKSEPNGDASKTAVEQPSVPVLGFRFADPINSSWWYDEDFGFFTLVSDGWLWHSDSNTFYWSGAFGHFDSEDGLFLYQWKNQQWVWLRRDRYPDYWNRDADDFFPLF